MVGTRSVRLAGLGGCALFAALALLSGLDRMGADSAQVAERLPDRLQWLALRQTGQAAIAAEDPDRAEEVANLAIRRTPLEPASAAMVGAALWLSGEDERAGAAYSVAGLLGWRVPLTQVYLIDRSLAAANYDAAAQRLDALLRQYPDSPVAAPYIDVMTARPEGAAALARRMENAPLWLPAFVGQSASATPPALAGRVDALARVRNLPDALGCEAAAPLVQRLVADSRFDVAYRTWSQACPHDPAQFAHDGNFASARIDQDRSAFDWSFIGSPEVSITVVRQGDARKVAVSNFGEAAEVFMRQLTMAPAGTYRVGWTTSGDGSGAMSVALGCDVQPRSFVAGRADARQPGLYYADIAVDASCPAKWLNFSVAPKIEGAELKSVSVVRLGTTGRASAPQ